MTPEQESKAIKRAAELAGINPIQAELPAPNDECAECGKTYENHFLISRMPPVPFCTLLFNDRRFFTPKPLQVEPYDMGKDWEQGLLRTSSADELAGAEATTKPDYLNKTLRECSREELMEALRVTEEKNKAIDAKSRISPEALDVRAGAEATGKPDSVEAYKERLREKIKALLFAPHWL